jgi:hypothetical protein
MGLVRKGIGRVVELGLIDHDVLVQPGELCIKFGNLFGDCRLVRPDDFSVSPVARSFHSSHRPAVLGPGEPLGSDHLEVD